MYDFITPEKIFDALRWLKANHPQYADIEINEEWSQESENIDFDLHAGFMKSMVQNDDNDSSADSVAGVAGVDATQGTTVNTVGVDNTALNSVSSSLHNS